MGQLCLLLSQSNTQSSLLLRNTFELIHISQAGLSNRELKILTFAIACI